MFKNIVSNEKYNMLYNTGLFLLAFACLLFGQATPDDYGRFMFHGISLNPLLFLVAGLFLLRDKTALKNTLKLQMPVIIALVMALIIQQFNFRGLNKSVNLVICSVIVVTLFLSLKWDTDKLIKHLIAVLLLIFLYAFFYKLKYGFIDSNIKYGLNGSIVFGRLMGIGLLASMFARYNRPFLNWLIPFIFSFAICWSYSRGVLVCAIIALLFVAYKNFELRRRSILFVVLMCVMSVSLILLTKRGLHKFHEVQRKILKDEGEYYINIKRELWKLSLMDLDNNMPQCIDEPPCVNRSNLWVNTINQRIISAKLSFELILHKPSILLNGVGLGRWGDLFVLCRKIEYPHNLFLEIFVEMGIILGLLILWPYFYFLSNLKSWTAAICIFLMFSQQISGDLLDSRYLLIFACLARQEFLDRKKELSKT